MKIGNKNFDDSLKTLAANTIRFLAVDGVQKANSGHPGMPMGMADVAFVLWTQFLKYNPKDSKWLNRDRFVLSAGHGSMLIYSMLHLAGYETTLEDLKQFRQWKSKTPGHPELNVMPGVETTTGPLGQGIGNMVGMALAEKILAEKYNDDTYTLFDNTIFGISGDGCQMEGVSSEAVSLAGHLKLGNIVLIYDDNQITIEGETRLAFSEDVGKRYEAYGWHVVKIDAHDHEQIAKGIQQGIDEKSKPTIIIAKSKIGFGSPNKEGKEESHGAPLGDDEIKLTKENLNFPVEPSFHVPQEVYDVFNARAEENKGTYDAWKEMFAKWESANPEKAKEFKSILNREYPEDLEAQLISALPDKPAATRAIGGKVVNKASQIIPGLYGGSADLSPSTKTNIVDSESIAPGSYTGRNLHFGVREHGMGSVMNGMAVYCDGLIPYGSTFMVFADYMRPPIRIAAIQHSQAIYVLTHDSIFVGEDGPTHQPVETLASLRAIPNLNVFRPADGVETAIAWAYAIRRTNGPTAICLTRQGVPILERAADFDTEIIKKGGYVIEKESGSDIDVVLVASGSEVANAIDARKILEEQGKSVRVVSMPCLDIFQKQTDEYKQSVIPQDVPVVVVEAGIEMGWHSITRAPFLFIGLNTFGASAPAKKLVEEYGFNGPSVAEMTACWMKEF